MSVHYFEYYPHYMGTTTAEIKFTDKEFAGLLALAKKAIKSHKVDDLDTTDILEEFDAVCDEFAKKKTDETVYSLTDALVNCYESPRRPASIIAALKKKGVWSGEWEEGSFAFSNKGKKAARKAVMKIEAQHMMDGF